MKWFGEKMAKEKANITMSIIIFIIICIFSLSLFYVYNITINKQIKSYKQSQLMQISLIKKMILKEMGTVIKKPLESINKHINNENEIPNISDTFKLNGLEEVKYINLISKSTNSLKEIDYKNNGLNKKYILSIRKTILNNLEGKWINIDDYKNSYFITPFKVTNEFQMMFVHYPIFFDDNKQFILTFATDLNMVASNFIKDIKIGENGSGGIIDGKGNVIYDTDKTVIGLNIFNLHENYPGVIEFDDEMLSTEKGVKKYDFLIRESNESVTKYGLWDTIEIEENKLKIATFVPEEDVIGNFIRFRNKILIIGSLLIIFIIISGVSLYNYNNRTLINNEKYIRGKYNEKTKELKIKNKNLDRLNWKLNNLFKYDNIIFWSIDMNSYEIIDLSGPIKKLYGYEIEDFISEPHLFKKVVDPRDKERIKNKKASLFEDDNVVKSIYRIQTSDDEIKWIKDVTISFKNEGKIERIDGIIFDITENKLNEEKLEEEKIRFENILKTTQDGFALIDMYGNFLEVNQAYLDMIGYSKEEILDMNIAEIDVNYNEDEIKDIIKEIQINDCKLFESKHRNKNKYNIDVEISATFNNYRESFLIIFIRDITDRKEEEAIIKYLSYHDGMTNLYNRTYFDKEMERFNHSRQVPISIITGDLDNLKAVNDNYGHKKGDKYIKKAADILNEATRHEDIVARFGGDEFAILLPNTNQKQVENICNRIREKIKKINKEFKFDIPLNISLGYKTINDQNTNIFDALNDSDKRMYVNKEKNKRREN